MVQLHAERISTMLTIPLQVWRIPSVSRMSTKLRPVSPWVAMPGFSTWVQGNPILSAGLLWWERAHYQPP
jgi:hypothetical protein